MDETTTVEALTTLGLSTYAAQAFIGLQKVGVASASDVAAVTDVPRSQVYGATDELESLGLIDVQQGPPKQYRPIGVEAAREILYARIESTADPAFEYLESVRGQQTDEHEGREAIWTTEGRANVTARVTSLVADASDRILFAATAPELIDDPVTDALRQAQDRGVSVTVSSNDPAAREAATAAGLPVVEPGAESMNLSVGRVLVVDDQTVLLSVLPIADFPHIHVESAFWSAETGFAVILAGLVDEQFG